ncbi:peptidoglycan editing factor PgeF [Rossellomorea aquimaris]|uniref:peptidoglycan editing factor PgeF n=1 Tax=Rossellomorea aquimaris TaxID=189382 RepID=UPI0007D05D78|nr:peptidoglycan editing factor PgeF [Rossellomorea aquimaris]
MSNEPFLKETESYYSLKQWTGNFPGLVAGITTRLEGVSKAPFQSLNMGLHVGDSALSVIRNREKVASSLNFPLSSWVGCEQTHGNQIRVVNIDHKGLGATSYDSSMNDTDGLITIEKNLLLTMCYADCVPLYFIDKVTGLIAVAHAGWKGTVLEIGPKMLKKFLDYGSSISNLEVVIGPSICKKCYIVDNRVIDKVKKILEDEINLPYNLVEEGQYNLDLKKVNELLLLKSGLNSIQIHTSNYCSLCSEEFFSFRGDGGTTGRMMSFIGWKEPSYES